MVVQHRLDRGERLIGAKLGLTSRAKQEAMGVHEPLYGWLTSGMVLRTASRCRWTSSSTRGSSPRSPS